MYVKFKSYPLNKMDVPVAFVMIKIHLIKTTLKAEITMQDGRQYELMNQWASEEEFDREIQNFVNDKFYGL
jgi:hypothetical protein